MLDTEVTISLATLHRMPLYLKLLKEKRVQGVENISSVGIAEDLALNPSLVKKDLSVVISSEGKPKIGYSVIELIADIEKFLGYDNTQDAILIGAGKLGQALMGYKGFAEYGLNIVAGFDANDEIIGKEINGKIILPTGKIDSLVKKLNIKLAILTIPQEHAQVMADVLVASGIRGIWNFSPATIKVPDNVALRNENMAVSFAVLSNQMKEILNRDK